MQVIGFTATVGAGWYSQVKDEVSFEDFLAQCKFNGIGYANKEGDQKDSVEMYNWNDVQIVDYDDDEGVMEFHFDEPKLYLEVHPFLRKTSATNSQIQLVLKEGN